MAQRGPPPPPPNKLTKLPKPQNLFEPVSLKQVPKDEIVIRQTQGSSELIKSSGNIKPTVQHPWKGSHPQVVLIITKTAWVAHEWLNEKIVKILFTTETALPQIREAKAENKFAAIETFQDLTSGLVEYKASVLHKSWNFTHVIAFAEEDLIRAARIRQAFGITHGQDEESALMYRDKIKMKKCLSEAGIKVPICAPVESASDVVKFCEQHGFDVVIKPRKGYSSVNTWIIHGEADLLKFLDSGFNRIAGFDSALDLQIETFCVGEMYHVDGFVYDNDIKLCWPSKYTNPCVDFKNSKYLASYTLLPTNPLTLKLQEYMTSCVKALGGPSCFPFHGEAFVTPDNDIVFCEIGSRTGGAGVRHQIWNLFGIMPDKSFCQWQAEDEVTHPELGHSWDKRQPDLAESIGWLFIYPSTGKITAIPQSCPLPFCVAYKAFAEVGTVFQKRENCVDAVASFVYSGKTEAEMVQNVERLYEWFSSACIYKPESS